MKAFLVAFGFLLVGQGVHAQSMPALYLNEQDEEVVPDSATHYRIIDRHTDAGYAFHDHALNGVLLTRGTLSSLDPPLRTGTLTWYHPNGAKASQVHLDDDEATGVYVAWYENGRVRERGQYEDGQRTGRWVTVHPNGQKRSEGRYLYGRQIGEWRYYYDNGQPSALEIPDRSKGPALAYFNEDGSPYVGRLQRRVQPEFQGGETALLDYLWRNTHYPKDARRKGISGKVEVSYTVDEQGLVTQVRIVHGLAPDIDSEALRVVRSLPRFRPGREYNIPTAMTFTVPIQFSPNFPLFSRTRPVQTPPTEARAFTPEQLSQ